MESMAVNFVENRASERKRLLGSTDAFLREPMRRNIEIKKQVQEFATRYDKKFRSKQKKISPLPRIPKFSSSTPITFTDKTVKKHEVLNKTQHKFSSSMMIDRSSLMASKHHKT